MFTQYDRLVRAELADLQEESSSKRASANVEEARKQAQKSFRKSVESLQFNMRRLGIPMPPYVAVSGKFLGILAIVLSDNDNSLVRRGYEDGLSSLVKVTWDIFGKQVTGRTAL